MRLVAASIRKVTASTGGKSISWNVRYISRHHTFDAKVYIIIANICKNELTLKSGEHASVNWGTQNTTINTHIVRVVLILDNRIHAQKFYIPTILRSITRNRRTDVRKTSAGYRLTFCNILMEQLREFWTVIIISSCEELSSENGQWTWPKWKVGIAVGKYKN